MSFEDMKRRGFGVKSFGKYYLNQWFVIYKIEGLRALFFSPTNEECKSEYREK